MSGNQLSLSNVINISVSSPQAGIGQYNTSNLSLFTEEVYADSFGSAGYKIYLSPQDVATDFGTSSKTYSMALSVFSQRPNILGGSGYLVIIPYIPGQVTLTLSGVAASGSFVANYGGHASAAIAWDDTAGEIEDKLQAVQGLEEVSVTGSISGLSLVILMAGVYSPTAITITSDSLQTSGAVAVTVTPTVSVVAETLAQAITRTTGLIQYFGIMGTVVFSETDMLAAAAIVQAQNNIAFFVSNVSADVEPDGLLDLLPQNSYSNSRGLFYGGTLSSALKMMASYASRGLSVNFSGSNTTITMHLKDLIGVSADPSMTQTLLNKCKSAGADTYVSLEGVAKVFCSGVNTFFDQVYNLQWFVGAIQVAGFNYLAQSSTKIPQTEAGMTGLKSAYRQVCVQAITNQYGAPGVWTSADTFGNLDDFDANIAQYGYYIYSVPISQQSTADREDRIAPLVQIALKEAGAIQSSDVIVFINA